jgi:hypothetical protein
MAELRRQFRPDNVATLFIGESSPAGGTHFYLANSNLFRATREAFAAAYGEDAIPDGPRFLHWFRERGCWLIDVADRPVNRLPDAEPRAAVAAGATGLAEIIRETAPDRIVAVKATIAPIVREAAERAEFSGEIVELPFPVRQCGSCTCGSSRIGYCLRAARESPNRPAANGFWRLAAGESAES